jgi:lipid-A-disaccharide synthase-like uncharacterized protein
MDWFTEFFAGTIDNWNALSLTEKIWLGIGFGGQVVFGLRFIVQWIATERRKKSVIPIGFWYLSLAGSIILLAYAIHQRDPVFILGFSLNMIIYLRNLYFIHFHKHEELTNEED